MAVHFVGDNGPDGNTLGTATTELISFYGSAPIVKPSVTQQATATTTANRADLDSLMTALSNLGLITLT
jgi:ABC-type cobalamin transport system ATPase subunit